MKNLIFATTELLTILKLKHSKLYKSQYSHIKTNTRRVRSEDSCRQPSPVTPVSFLTPPNCFCHFAAIAMDDN